MKKITMYSGDPCPYCGAAKALLKSKNIEIEEFDIWKDAAKAKEMLQRTNGKRTIPQMFIGDHYVGGNDELQALNRSGELDKLLALLISPRKGIASPAPNLVVDIPATLLASSRHSLIGFFFNKQKANPPLKASPAPVVSIAFTGLAAK